MKKFALFPVLLLAAAALVFASGKGESWKYSVGICYNSPDTAADQAVVRAIVSVLSESHIKAMPYDTGTDSSGMLSRVDLLLKDRGIHGIIIITDDQAASADITVKCADNKVPVAILGRGPEDPVSFPAIVVGYNELTGYEKLMEGAFRLGSTKNETVKPLFLTTATGNPPFNKLFGHYSSTRYLSEKTGISQSETGKIVTAILKKNRDINLIMLPGSDVETLKVPLIQMGKWLNIDDPLHVTIGCFDGSARAVEYLEAGYIDLIGGRDVVREAESLVFPLMENISEGKGQVSLDIHVPGRFITREDLTDRHKAAWNDLVPQNSPGEETTEGE